MVSGEVVASIGRTGASVISELLLVVTIAQPSVSPIAFVHRGNMLLVTMPRAVLLSV